MADTWHILLGQLNSAVIFRPRMNDSTAYCKGIAGLKLRFLIFASGNQTCIICLVYETEVTTLLFELYLFQLVCCC